MGLNHRPLDWQSGALPCDHRSPCACSLYCFWRLCRLNVWRWGVLTPSVWASGGQRGRLWSSVYSVGEVARTMHYVLLRIVFKLIIPFGSVVVLIICYTLLAITMLMNIRAAHGNVGVAPPTVPGPSVDSSVTTNGTATVDVTSSKNSSVPGIKKTKAKEAKDESLLFIITVGRFACWAPYWLYKAGVYVPIIINMFIFGTPSSTHLSIAVSGMFRDDVRQFYRQMRSRLTSCLQLAIF